MGWGALTPLLQAPPRAADAQAARLSENGARLSILKRWPEGQASNLANIRGPAVWRRHCHAFPQLALVVATIFFFFLLLFFSHPPTPPLGHCLYIVHLPSSGWQVQSLRSCQWAPSLPLYSFLQRCPRSALTLPHPSHEYHLCALPLPRSGVPGSQRGTFTCLWCPGFCSYHPGLMLMVHRTVHISILKKLLPEGLASNHPESRAD